MNCTQWFAQEREWVLVLHQYSSNARVACVSLDDELLGEVR